MEQNNSKESQKTPHSTATVQENIVSNDEKIVSEDKKTISEDEKIVPEDEKIVSGDEKTVSEDEKIAPEDEKIVSEDEKTVSEDEKILSNDDYAETENISLINASISNDTYSETLNALIREIDTSEEKDLKESSEANYQYKITCKKYKTFPLVKCITNTDGDTLDIPNYNIGPEIFKPVVEALMFSTKITHIIVPGNRLGNKGLKYLSYLFIISSTIKHLNLANNMIGAHSGELIQKILGKGFNLEFIDLSENELEDRHLRQFSLTLNDPPLKVLNLKSNKFRVESGEILANCLSKNNSINFLDFSSNEMQIGAENFFKGLQKNKCLNSLNLSRNGINDVCSPNLGIFLRVHKEIEDLDLSFNKLTDECINKISKGLKANTSIKFLNLSFNPIHVLGAQTLLNCSTKAESKLKRINLSGVRVNYKFLKALNDITKSGRDLEVLYGTRIRSEICNEYKPRLKNDGVLMQVIKHADSKGLNFKEFLRAIHAQFLIDKLTLESIKNEAKEMSKESKPENGVIDPSVMEKMYPRMKSEKFIYILTTSNLKLPQELAKDFAKLYENEEETVDIGAIAAEIPLRKDILQHEYEPVEKEEPDKKDKKKK